MFHSGNKRTIYLYQGVRSGKDLYMDKLCLEWREAFEQFNYIPVFSEPNKKDNIEIRTGLVHEAVMNDFESFENFQIYSCGPPILIESAYSSLLEKGLSEDDFFADAFTFAPPKK